MGRRAAGGDGAARRPAVPARRGGGGVVDTHAHLDSCDGEPGELLAEARAAGVERVIAIGVGRASSERTIALAEAHPQVRCAIGVHPYDADAYGPDDEAWIRDLAAHPAVVAIGECGLDHHRPNAAPEAQRRAFASQIRIARAAELPLVVHTRDAARETLDLLAAEADGHPVVMHCFSIPEHLDEVVARGWMTSFAGQVTYPKATDLQAAARAVPEELLLVETDSPYLSPAPRRGRPNRPANLAHTLRFIAALRGAGEAELDARTTANAARVFGI